LNSTPDKQYRKNPETYLNNKSWNDEIIGNNKKRDMSSMDREQEMILSKFQD